jgi:hypothetical protein
MLPYAAVASVTGNTPIPEPFPAGLADQYAMYYGQHRVWQSLHAALWTLRRARPELNWLRAEHARLACVAGRHAVASRELADVGNDPRGAGFIDQRELDFYQEWARTGRPPNP